MTESEVEVVLNALHERLMCLEEATKDPQPDPAAELSLIKGQVEDALDELVRMMAEHKGVSRERISEARILFALLTGTAVSGMHFNQKLREVSERTGEWIGEIN